MYGLLFQMNLCSMLKIMNMTMSKILHVTWQEHRGLMSIRYPMEHGIVKDWNDMERIWQYIYSKDQLQTFSEEVTDRFSWCKVNPLLGAA